MKIKLFTHTDLDGATCALLIRLLDASFDNEDISYCAPQDVSQSVLHFIVSADFYKYDAVYITDLGVDEEACAAIDKTNRIQSRRPERFRIMLIDHHSSSAHLNAYNWATVASEISGKRTCAAELFWRKIQKDGLYDATPKPNALQRANIGTLIELVRIRDNYEFAAAQLGMSATADDLNILFAVKDRDAFLRLVSNLSISERKMAPADFIPKNERCLIEYLKNKRNAYVREKAEGAIEFPFLEHRTGVVFAEKHASEIGDAVCKMYSNLDFAMIVNMDGMRVSLRSNGFDLTETARRMGGGGHPQAAGFRLDANKETLLKNLFCQREK